MKIPKDEDPFTLAIIVYPLCMMVLLLVVFGPTMCQALGVERP